MEFGTMQAVAAALALAIMAFGIVDVLLIGRKRFAALNRRMSGWVLLILFFGPLAVLLYAAAVRPQLRHPERYADDEGVTPDEPTRESQVV